MITFAAIEYEFINCNASRKIIAYFSLLNYEGGSYVQYGIKLGCADQMVEWMSNHHCYERARY